MKAQPISDDDWGDLFARMGAPAQKAVQEVRKQLPPEPEPPVPPPFEHRCGVCGGFAYWGYDVSVRQDKLGEWYCNEHRPDRRSRS